MYYRTFNLIIAFVCWLNVCAAQPATKQSIEWGQSISGAELSVATDTNVFVRDASFTAICHVRNTSTNDISYADTNPEFDFQLILYNDSGKIYRLSPNPASQSVYRRVVHKISEGEIVAQTITLPVGKDVDPGAYHLKAELNVYINVKANDVKDIDSYRYTLISNILEIKIQ